METKTQDISEVTDFLMKESFYIMMFFCISTISVLVQQIGGKRFLQQLEFSNIKNKEQCNRLVTLIKSVSFIGWLCVTLLIIEELGCSGSSQTQEQDIYIESKWILLMILAMMTASQGLQWERARKVIETKQNRAFKPILKFSHAQQEELVVLLAAEKQAPKVTVAKVESKLAEPKSAVQRVRDVAELRNRG